MQGGARGDELVSELNAGVTWRLSLLNALARPAAVLASLAYPIMATQVLTWRDTRALSFMALQYALLLVVALRTSLPYTVRAITFLVCLGFGPVAGFILVGYQVGPGICAALCVVLSGLLLGRRSMLLTFCLSVIALVSVGLFHVHTQAEHVVPQVNDPSLLRNWIRNAVVFTLFTGVLSAGVMFVVTHIERSLADRTESLRRIQAEEAARREAERALGDAESTIHQIQKLEAVGRLASGVAHDFNNLLVVILGWADLMHSKAIDPTAWQSGLDEILAAGHRAASLTQQLLAFSQKNVITPKPVALDSLVAELARTLVRVLRANITLVTHVAKDVPAVFADPTQVHLALLNLCINARDAMPQGGTLEVRAEVRAAVAGVAGGPWVALTVRDTGLGMDEATRARLFTPFFTTKGELGTGLGLASVRAIMEKLRGHVTLETKLGEGTTFTLLLPPAPASELVQSSSQARPMTNLLGTILVAEDDTAVRKLIVDTLRAAGHTVIAGESGNVVLEQARRYRGKIDVLCTDSILRDVASGALIDGFRALFPGGAVLLCSGHVGEPVPVDVSCLNKPFTSGELVQAVAQLLNERTSRAEPTLDAARS